MSTLIDKVEVIEFDVDTPDYTRTFDTDARGGSWYYQPGVVGKRGVLMVRVYTTDGHVGEYAYHAVTGAAQQAADVARIAVGRPWHAREQIFRVGRRLSRPAHSYGLCFLDNALWDLAGKVYGASLTELLGGGRDRVRAYASSVNGDREGSLSNKESIVEFFASLKNLGWTGFKMHSWHEGDKWEEAENVAYMREHLGERTDLMLDPACVFDSVSDAIFVGKACQEAGFRWYEDPLRPLGIGAFAHKQLRDALDIPILQSEHVAGPEAKADFLLAGGTDLLRVDSHFDLGVTGSVKTIKFAESLGVNVEVHGPSPVHRHLVASMQATSMYEVANVSPHLADPSPEIYTCGYSDAYTTIAADGTLPVPTGPGIGVTYDAELIEKRTKAAATITAES
ncbi:mandelate racemase/muconate lactonizing enzyme family protein [Amycolatopsis acidicola]|uniref:Mandelate racemase/muconate lactonizing enzyme family protein n=1 Tax=Amycolatopsis acidicola TaxID=2596893 RepID=A0A5N0UIN8_9PSEU|nr:enolase C-terminal domain-like protein [Amycolatopsis acidicola]KAA9148119.1 mandelate racemase/muconate lactonizing enzyme family protein [Amycolatopsis acidicola]